MNPETIGVTVTFRESVTFHLRMIGVAEEAALRQKMFGKTEAEREAESYLHNVNMLADLSVEMPTVRRLVKTMEKRGTDKEEREYEKLKEVDLVEDVFDEKNAVREFFSEKTVVKERIAEYAVRGYFVKLVPDISFA